MKTKKEFFNIEDSEFADYNEFAEHIFYEASVLRSHQLLGKALVQMDIPPRSMLKDVLHFKINDMDDVQRLYNKMGYGMRKFLGSFLVEKSDVEKNEEKIQSYKGIYNKLEYYIKENKIADARMLLMNEKLLKEPTWAQVKKILKSYDADPLVIEKFQDNLLTNCSKICNGMLKKKLTEEPVKQLIKENKVNVIKSAIVGGGAYAAATFIGVTNPLAIVAGSLLLNPLINMVKGKGSDIMKKFAGALLSKKSWRTQVAVLTNMKDFFDKHFEYIAQNNHSNDFYEKTILDKVYVYNDKFAEVPHYLLKEENFVPSLATHFELREFDKQNSGQKVVFLSQAKPEEHYHAAERFKELARQGVNTTMEADVMSEEPTKNATSLPPNVFRIK